MFHPLSSFIIIFKKRLAHLFSPGPGLIPAHKTLFGLESNKFYLFFKKKRITNRGRERESCGYIIFTLNGQSIPEKRGALLYPPYPISPSSPSSLLGFLCVFAAAAAGITLLPFKDIAFVLIKLSCFPFSTFFSIPRERERKRKRVVERPRDSRPARIYKYEYMTGRDDKRWRDQITPKRSQSLSLLLPVEIGQQRKKVERTHIIIKHSPLFDVL